MAQDTKIDAQFGGTQLNRFPASAVCCAAELSRKSPAIFVKTPRRISFAPSLTTSLNCSGIPRHLGCQVPGSPARWFGPVPVTGWEAQSFARTI